MIEWYFDNWILTLIKKKTEICMFIFERLIDFKFENC